MLTNLISVRRRSSQADHERFPSMLADGTDHKLGGGPLSEGRTSQSRYCTSRFTDAVSQTKTEFDNLKSDFLSALLITSLPLPLKINSCFIRRICFSTPPPPLPSRLRAIRCHFDHGYLAKREEEGKKAYLPIICTDALCRAADLNLPVS